MGDNVQLRGVDHADLEVFFEQEQDLEAARRANFPPRDRETFMTHWETKVLPGPTNLVRTVTVDGETAGSFMAWWEEDRRFIGYWLDRRYWGQGIGTRALTLFLSEEKARPLHADPHAGNTGSIRLLERCGFQREGTDERGHVMLVLREE